MPRAKGVQGNIEGRPGRDGTGRTAEPASVWSGNLFWKLPFAYMYEFPSMPFHLHIHYGTSAWVARRRAIAIFARHETSFGPLSHVSVGGQGAGSREVGNSRRRHAPPRTPVWSASAVLMPKAPELLCRLDILNANGAGGMSSEVSVLRSMYCAVLLAPVRTCRWYVLHCRQS